MDNVFGTTAEQLATSTTAALRAGSILSWSKYYIFIWIVVSCLGVCFHVVCNLVKIPTKKKLFLVSKIFFLIN